MTNAFSKKFEDHAHVVGRYSVWYNFARIHKTLRVGPAMAAGIADRLWCMENGAALVDAADAEPGKRRSYEKSCWETKIMPNIIAANEGSPQGYLGLSLDWKITGKQSRGAFALVEAVGSNGSEPPLHYHEGADEFFYIVSGDMTFRVGAETKRIGSGGFVWIPRAVVHGFIIHADDSRFLFGFVPAGLEQMFIAISTPSSETSSIETREETGSAVDSHRERHGTVVAGPRLSAVLNAENGISD